jgi:hypothetical protein
MPLVKWRIEKHASYIMDIEWKMLNSKVFIHYGYNYINFLSISRRSGKEKGLLD